MKAYRVSESGLVSATGTEVFESVEHSAPITRILPTEMVVQTRSGTLSAAREVHIFDASGSAGTHSITVVPGSPGQMINGLSSYVIETNYYTATFRRDADGNWSVSDSQNPGAPTFSVPGASVIQTALQRESTDIVYVARFMSKALLAEIAAGSLLTDTSTVIQLAIDWAIYRGSAGKTGTTRVELPGGQFRMNNNIHLGYGTSFTSVILQGQGPKVTTLHCMFSDRPGIVIQGGRVTCVKDLGLLGLNAQHLVSLLSGINDSHIDAATWVDPTLHANAASRWAPYAGIASDPYCGPPPAQQYPTPSYPAFLGAVSPYNKNFSSQTRLENVEIQGFVVGYLNQVGDATGNGDYTKLEKCTISYCQYGVSICNTQARVTEIDKSAVVICHTGIVTTKHGRQTGKPSIRVTGTEIGLCIKMLDVPNLASGMGPQFDFCYGEGIYSIGSAGTAASNQDAVSFHNCELALGMNGMGWPEYVFRYDGTGIATFDNCGLHSNLSAASTFTFYGANSARSYRFTGGNVWTDADAPTALYQKFARNATLGLLFVGPGPVGIGVDLLDFSARVTQHWNLDTGSALGSRIYGRKNDGPRSRCLCAYTERVVTDLGRDEGFFVPQWSTANNNGVSKSGLTYTVSGRDVTFSLAGRTEAQFALDGPDVGDVVWDETSGVTFYVRSRAETTITMRAQTGFNAADALYKSLTTTGLLYFLNTRKFSLSVPTYGNTTAGSAMMTGIARGDGDSSHLTTDIAVGDSFLVCSTHDSYIPAASSKVSAISQLEKTVTAAGTFSRTEGRVRLKLLVRAAAPNA